MALPLNTPSLASDPEGDLEQLRAVLKPQEDLVVKKLSTHIESVWAQVQKDNKPVREEMVKTLRRVRGEYDQVKLTQIRAFQGSEAYIRSGENKARCAESWIKDIYRGASDLPWELAPTAEPELPDETRAQAEEQTRQYADAMQQELLLRGVVPDPARIGKLLNDYYQELLDKATDDIRREAKERCNRASSVIRDQNQEGGWNAAFKDFLYWFVRTKAGIIKGPVLTKKKKQSWTMGEAGFTLETADQLAYDVYAVSPFNFFPSRGMKSVNDGDIIELHEMTKQAIADMIGVPGYSEAEIRAVLDEYQGGSLKAKWFTIEDETAVKQVTKEKITKTATTPPTQNSTDLASETIWAQEFYGTVSGKLLLEWGLEGLDEALQYQANCWKIGKHVIKAVINPDSLGRKPYHVTSWAKNPEWIWGEGLIEFVKDVEDALNAITRALINNIAIASGPMAEIDKDRVDTKTPIYPWRQIESTSLSMKNEGPAVVYYQPQMHAGELIQAWQFFAKVLDEMTVPAYAQGASQSGVTAGTATVFTQLLAAASRSIKAVVANIDDDILTPYLQMHYDFIMKFTDDDTLKGDARVVAKGVSGLLAKEQATQRKVEALQIITAPIIAQILGAKNIGSIVAQILKGQDIDLPDLERLEGTETAQLQIEQLLRAQAGVQPGPDPNDPNQMNGQTTRGGGAPDQGQGLNPDGSKAGIVNQ